MARHRPRRRHRNHRRAADRSAYRLQGQARHRRGHVPQAHPAGSDRSKIAASDGSRSAAGARRPARASTFEDLGHKVSYETEEAHRAGRRGHRLHARRQREQEEVLRASSPATRRASSPRAASSASASRTRAASTTRRSCRGQDQFIQVVSCNTHNLSILIKTLGYDGEARESASRAASSACAGPTTSPRTTASCPRRRSASTRIAFGTHHARDAWHLFKTMDHASISSRPR